MGPTLARMAKRAAPERRVIGVARFSQPGLRARTASAHGVECIEADLLSRDALARLPDAPNIVFMAGPQVRLDRQRMADLGDERPCAGAGGRALRAFAHRRFLHRLRLSVRQHRRQRRRRGRAAHGALGRIREFLRGARAHVPALLAPVPDTGPAAAPVLCDRHALRRAARRRAEGAAARADRPGDGPCQHHLAGRGQRLGAALAGALRHAHFAAEPQRTRRSASAKWRRRWGSAWAWRPCSRARKRRPPGWSIAPRPSSCSARRRSAWTACWTGPPTGCRRGGATLGKPTHYEARDGKY